MQNVGCLSAKLGPLPELSLPELSVCAVTVCNCKNGTNAINGKIVAIVRIVYFVFVICFVSPPISIAKTIDLHCFGVHAVYCRDALHLQVINKESNRKILQALKDSYPLGLDAIELAEKTDLPLKTIYGQKVELYRQFYISNYYEEPKSIKRGRPRLVPQDNAAGERHRDKYVIEETNGVHDVYDRKKAIPLPPGNVQYTNGFVDVWHKLVGKEEEEALCIVLLRFIEKILARINDHNDAKVRKWAPMEIYNNVVLSAD